MFSKQSTPRNQDPDDHTLNGRCLTQKGVPHFPTHPCARPAVRPQVRLSARPPVRYSARPLVCPSACPYVFSSVRLEILVQNVHGQFRATYKWTLRCEIYMDISSRNVHLQFGAKSVWTFRHGRCMDISARKWKMQEINENREITIQFTNYGTRTDVKLPNALLNGGACLWFFPATKQQQTKRQTNKKNN